MPVLHILTENDQCQLKCGEWLLIEAIDGWTSQYEPIVTYWWLLRSRAQPTHCVSTENVILKKDDRQFGQYCWNWLLCSIRANDWKKAIENEMTLKNDERKLTILIMTLDNEDWLKNS